MAAPPPMGGEPDVLARAASAAPGPGLGDTIMKVNHAGEHGAVHIYRGQILMARLTARHMLPELRECLAHEQRHRAIFAAELTRRNRPRCASFWLCAIGGYVLGIITGLFGTKAIAATTVAVEQVVLRHLREQLTALAGVDEEACHAIEQIVAEEQAHLHMHSQYLEAGGFWPGVLTPIVAASTEAVIFIGMRV